MVSFRLFRILWYYKIPVVKRWLNYNFELSLFSRHEQTAVDKSYRSTLYVAMKLMVQNLESLGREMFTVTGRGGLLLMLIFFYTGIHT